ncbi:MAG TPA: glycosyltransferase [Gemmatimonadaceae bacterium]|nr:glycosyltransferase [Gemmatimonadaceae bacterium]
MKILCFADYYLPGFKAGGPIRALSNLVDAFAGEIDFDIVTREYDLGGERYPDVTRGAWHNVGAARVRYVGERGLLRSELRRMLLDASYDAVYLNSMFSPLSRAVLRERFLAGATRPLIIAPRGEFSRAALKLKSIRKTAYLALLKRIGALKAIFWQASSAHEADDIKAIIGDRASIFVTQEIPGQPAGIVERASKRSGTAAVTFLSRICRMKNLDTAIEVLSGVKGNVEFAVYGPIEDRDYWGAAVRAASQLPDNIKFTYKGVIPQDSVATVLAHSDLFLLPTRGENYGHVIIEALAAGCPVLISDRTRWRDLELAGIGWDVSLNDLAGFRSALEHVIQMGEDQHSRMRANARDYALRVQTDTAVIAQNRQLFEAAAGNGNMRNGSIKANAEFATHFAGATQSRGIR